LWTSTDIYAPNWRLGMKACEYAQEQLRKGNEPTGRISVLAENCSSALDALQVLLGVTLGNQCLKVLDFGKHNYTFSVRDANAGFTLRLRALFYGDEQEYEILEEKIVHNQISLDEVVKFQELLDARALKLLTSRPEDLFDVIDAGETVQTLETPAAYLSCAGCGQPVLKEHAIEFQGRRYCAPCLQLLERSKAGQSLH
jgi:formylmethanofuran dehydrogenase subunit E